MLLLALAAFGSVIYGVYRATRRWGVAVLWYVAAAASALDAGGVITEHFWGPRYSWNFSHHGWHSLRATVTSFCFYLGMALWQRAGNPKASR